MNRGSIRSGDERAVEPHRNALTEARRVLDGCILFAGLSDQERAAIFARARIRNVSPGEMLFTIGSPGDHMMAVIHGTIRISVPSSEGKELLIAIIKPGEIVGELSVLDGHERSADAKAASACTLAILDRRDILPFLDRNPSTWPRLIKLLCQRLRQTDQILAELALLELPVRLAKAMLRTVPTTDSTMRSPKVTLSQRELANMVGATRESVNKCLRKWQRNGIVRMSEGAIYITNGPALAEVAEQS